MPLTLAEANKIVEVAVAKAKELKLPMAVAVCDAEGRLMAFNRIEGTFWITAFAAQGKAAAATAFGRSSADLQDIGSSAAFQALSAQEGNHMVPVQGALPIFKDGQILGAAGASGGTAQEDEDCVRAGIQALGL
jgi:uncharacterized protein GlcG (DUF336 family)